MTHGQAEPGVPPVGYVKRKGSRVSGLWKSTFALTRERRCAILWARCGGNAPRFWSNLVEVGLQEKP